MSSRLAQLAHDEARRDVTVGWITGIAVVAIRALGLLAALQAPLPIDWIQLALAMLQLLLAIAFSWLLYRRKVWASVALSALWGAGYFHSWLVDGRLTPPLGLIGLLIWYGLYRGIRGTRALAALARSRAHLSDPLATP